MAREIQTWQLTDEYISNCISFIFFPHQIVYLFIFVSQKVLPLDRLYWKGSKEILIIIQRNICWHHLWPPLQYRPQCYWKWKKNCLKNIPCLGIWNRYTTYLWSFLSCHLMGKNEMTKNNWLRIYCNYYLELWLLNVMVQKSGWLKLDWSNNI